MKCHPASLYELFEAFTFLKDVAQLQLVDMEWRKQAIEEHHMLNSSQLEIEF